MIKDNSGTSPKEFNSCTGFISLSKKEKKYSHRFRDNTFPINSQIDKQKGIPNLRSYAPLTLFSATT